jgi:hypothetical protein
MLFGGLWFALAVAAGLWASRQPWIVRTGNPIERRIGIGLSVALIPVLTYAIALLSGIALERVSSERYAAARSAFVADADGFPFLKKFALEHYGVHVVLSSAVSGWNTNTVALPHSIPALMYVGPGYCDLVLNYAVGRCLMLWSSNDVTQQGSRPKTKLVPLKPSFISPMFIQTAFSFSNAVQRWVCRFSGLRLVALRWFVVFLASGPCVASASSYFFRSAVPPRWHRAFSQLAPVAKLRLSVLASGSNISVKPTRILRSAYLAR